MSTPENRDALAVQLAGFIESLPVGRDWDHMSAATIADELLDGPLSDLSVLIIAPWLDALRDT